MNKYHKDSLKGIIDQAAPAPLFELTPKRIEKLKTYAEVTLAVLKIAAVLTAAAVAPNAIQALAIFEKKRRRRTSHRQKIQKVTKTFYYLKRRGYVEFKKRGDDDYEIKLTRLGRKQIRKLELDSITVPKPKFWDGYFWQVAADIPTKKFRRGADALRTKIKEMRFYPLQRTLWFYPYDPRVEIEFISRIYEVSQFVTVMKLAWLDPEDERKLTSFFRDQEII